VPWSYTYSAHISIACFNEVFTLGILAKIFQCFQHWKVIVMLLWFTKADLFSPSIDMYWPSIMCQVLT
jgi:hypothetical protein